MNAEALKKQFGLLLKTLRSEKGLSQEQLAHDCSLDRTYISMLERGVNQPSLTTLYSIAEALNVTPSDLLSRLDENF